MSPILINHLIGFVLLTVILPLIAWLVYSKNPSRPLNRSFSLYTIAISWWALFTIFMITERNKEWALFWDRMCLSSVVFIPSLFFYFVLSYIRRIERSQRLRRFVFLDFLVSLFFLVFLWNTPLFVKDVMPKFGMKYFTVPGPAYLFFIVFFLLNVISVLSLLGFFIRTIVDPKLKRQAVYLFWVSAIAYIGGSCNYLLVYDIQVPGVAETSNYGLLIYSLMITYLIFKHGFLEIDVIIKRTLVFTGLTAFVFGVLSFGLFIAQEVLAVYFGFKWEVALAISIFLIVLGYEPMRTFLIEMTDKYLFQKKYDYQKFLKDASRGIAQIESLHHLLGLVTHFITMRMRVKNAAVLTRDLKEGIFCLSFLRGYATGFGRDYSFPVQEELIRYLEQEKEGIDIERVRDHIQTGTQKKPDKGHPSFQYDFEQIKRQMEALQAACCIPSFLGKELRNVLVLGEKKSGDYYTTDDLNVLFTIAQESAIAIENARLYDEAIHRTQELQKINEEVGRANRELKNTQAQLIHEQKMATLGRLAASVGHEVNNPLTILSMNVSRTILKYKKSPDLKVVDILDIFQKMEQNIGRIKAVVNTLTGLLKKSEKGKFEPLSLKLILEETLPLVQFQTYLDNNSGTEVEFDIPSDLPLIKGDLERLQEVFLNLFINAYHALAGRRNPKIVVKARLTGEDSKMVSVEFTDNGSGMPEEIQKKIFTYGFTTKGPGRGSGMGLYICKYIIELHGGEIKVKSQPGVGSTFALTLPAFEETNPIGIPAGETFKA